MKKKFKTIMLSAEKASEMGLRINVNGESPMTKENKLALLSQKLGYGKDSLNWKYQHLYIISDDDIKPNNTHLNIGEWCVKFWGETKEVIKFDGTSNVCKKIIATTDKNINEPDKSIKDITYGILPQISESFIKDYIKAYNEGKPITAVDLEIIEGHGFDPTNQGKREYFTEIKTTPNNEVVIVNDTAHSKDEIINKLLEVLCMIAKEYKAKDVLGWRDLGLSNEDALNSAENNIVYKIALNAIKLATEQK